MLIRIKLLSNILLRCLLEYYQIAYDIILFKFYLWLDFKTEKDFDIRFAELDMYMMWQ